MVDSAHVIVGVAHMLSGVINDLVTVSLQYRMTWFTAKE